MGNFSQQSAASAPTGRETQQRKNRPDNASDKIADSTGNLTGQQRIAPNEA
jgi:hypothetical protein